MQGKGLDNAIILLLKTVLVSIQQTNITMQIIYHILFHRLPYVVKWDAKTRKWN